MLINGLIGCHPERVVDATDPALTKDLRQQENLENRNRQEPSIPSSEMLDPTLRVTRPWRIVFVSKDGPKGHEIYTPGTCDRSVWCQIWEGAEQAGTMAGADIELAYVAHDCAESYDCTIAQIQLIDQLIQRGDVDGMVIGPRESNLLVPVVEKSINAGIPVLITDTPLNTDQVITQVLPDDYQMGERLAQWVVTRLKGKGNVLLLNGPETQANALNRKRGILAGLGTSDIRVLDIQYAKEWTMQEAQAITQEWIEEFSNIDAIMAGGGDLALGIINELNDQAAEDMVVTSFDVYPQIETAIASGAIDITVDQQFVSQGQLSVQLLLRHLEAAETFHPVVYVPDSRLYMKDNIANVSP